MNDAYGDENKNVGVLLCLEGQHAALHERYAEAGGLWLVCQECGHVTYDGPDPEAVRYEDPSLSTDEEADTPIEGMEYHLEPPC